jgi:hypothetical protein
MATSLEQEIKDFLKRVTRMAKRDSSCAVFSLFSVTVISSGSQSVTIEKLPFTATAKEEKEDEEEDGDCSWSVVRM